MHAFIKVLCSKIFQASIYIDYRGRTILYLAYKLSFNYRLQKKKYYFYKIKSVLEVRLAFAFGFFFFFFFFWVENNFILK